MWRTGTCPGCIARFDRMRGTHTGGHADARTALRRGVHLTPRATHDAYVAPPRPRLAVAARAPARNARFPRACDAAAGRRYRSVAAVERAPSVPRWTQRIAASGRPGLGDRGRNQYWRRGDAAGLNRLVRPACQPVVSGWRPSGRPIRAHGNGITGRYGARCRWTRGVH